MNAFRNQLLLSVLVIGLSTHKCLSSVCFNDSLKKPREELFQKIYLGVKAGGNINRLNGFEESFEGGHSSINYTVQHNNPYYLGWNGGVYADFVINKFLSVQTELLYYRTFQKVRYSGNNSFAGYVNINADYSSSQIFYNVPILIKLTFGKSIRYYTSFGVSFGSSVYHENKGVYEKKSYNYFTQSSDSVIFYDNDIKQIFKGGANGVLSFGLQIPHKRSCFTVELRVQHNFKSITEEASYKNLIWMLNVGYAFPIVTEKHEAQ